MPQAIHLATHSLSVVLLVAMLLMDAAAFKVMLASHRKTQTVDRAVVTILACCTGVQFINVFIIQRL